MNEIIIPLAYYASITEEGLSWHCQEGDFSKEELLYCKEQIESNLRMTAKVFNFKGRMFFCRCHHVEGIDWKNRRAVYCVVGVIPTNDAKMINIEEVLKSDEFAKPVQRQGNNPLPLAYYIKYRGATANETGHGAPSSYTISDYDKKPEAVSYIGTWFSEYHPSEKTIEIEGDLDCPKFHLLERESPTLSSYSSTPQRRQEVGQGTTQNGKDNGDLREPQKLLDKIMVLLFVVCVVIVLFVGLYVVIIGNNNWDSGHKVFKCPFCKRSWTE